MSDFERFHVITGGPGSGKSTLIEALGRRGYAHSIEAGRAIIQDQTAIDGPALPGRDPLAFAELICPGSCARIAWRGPRPDPCSSIAAFPTWSATSICSDVPCRRM